jgi:fructose/tagatose bisphosphate aldolase
MKKYKAGVLFGDELESLYKDAKENQFALPAVNCIGTDTINATLEAAAKVNSPVIIQFSNGGAQFIAGKGMPNDQLQANISGWHIRRLAYSQCCQTLWCSCSVTHRPRFKKMAAMDQRIN